MPDSSSPMTSMVRSELTGRKQHREARLPVDVADADESLVHQLFQTIERVHALDLTLVATSSPKALAASK